MSQPLSVPRFTPVADHAVLVDFLAGDGRERSDAADAAANGSVVALDRALAAASLAGVHEVVPALVNLLVDFDPLVTDHVTVQSGLLDVWANATSVTLDPRLHSVAVCYDSSLGPDLEAVATACGISADAVVAAHLAGDYRVLMYGFAPGYAYLGGTPEAIRVPRKPTPVRDVPAGSIIIAGPQCLITTITMPTGWSVIGASPARVIPANPDEPFLFEPGDHVRFERVDRAEFDRSAGVQ